MTVAIGMPVYNAERWLAASLDSLLAQTHHDLAIVISDNASTDGTRDICADYVRRDARIRYFRNPVNIGVFRNYDAAFALSDAPFFKWASANDICAPTFVEECLRALRERPDACLAYPSTALFAEDISRAEAYAWDPDVCDADPLVRYRRVLTELRLNNAFNGVFRTAALRASPLNQVYRGSDIVLLAVLALSGKIARLPSRLFFRRMTPDASSARRDDHTLREFFAAEGRDIFGTPVWSFHSHCLRAVMAAPLPLSLRLRAAAFVGHQLWWQGPQLWREAVGAVTGHAGG